MSESVPTLKPESRERSVVSSLALTRATTLGERLRGERQHGFVGRAEELALFRQLLGNAQHSLLFFRGQVGIGKSALLQELLRVALAQGHRALLVDAVRVSPYTPSGALARQELLASLESGEPSVRGARSVLLVDGFEHNDWLLGELVAELPADVLVVCASRAEPPSTLALDPAWSRLMLLRELAPLSDSETEELLELRGVASGARDGIAELSGGFPLALAIASDVLKSTRTDVFPLDGLSTIHHTLARLLCPRSLTPAQQLALDVCALARVTTAELLDGVRQAFPLESGLEIEDAFNWLAHQPFVEWTSAGLYPHHLARFAFQGRLRRERPRRHRVLARALRELLVNELQVSRAPGSEVADLFFVDRNEPFVRRWTPVLEETSVKPVESAEPADRDRVIALIRAADGDEAASLAQGAFESGEISFDVVRDGGVAGVLGYTRFTAESGPAKLSSRDPVSALVRRFMQQHPLQGDEQSLLIRWFLDAEDYQTPSARLLPLNGRQSQLALATQHLPYSFCVFRTPLSWLPLWKTIQLPWELVETFKLGGHEYALVAFLWKRRPLREVLLHQGAGQIPSAAPEAALSFDELRVKVSERVANLARKVKLTPREVEILERLCLGHSAEDIAHQLSIRPRTVKFHQENLLRKTGANSRAELFGKLL